MANIFPIDFEEKLTMAQDDYILFSDSEDGNKIKKAQYKNLKGEQGNPGTPGADGQDGAAATITVGSTSTGAAGSSATVVNSGTSSAAVLDFTIPQGAKGEPGEDGQDGADGAAATITVGTTTTLPAGSSATVTNVGTSQDAILNFGIPKGDSGSGSGDVSGPASSVNGDVAIFDGTTGKLIKDGSVALSTLSAGASAGATAVQPGDIGTAAACNTGTASGNVPILDSNGKLATSTLPGVALTDTFTVSTSADLTTLSSADQGDIAIVTSENKTYVLSQAPYSTAANWKQILSPTGGVTSWNGQTGAVTYTAPVSSVNGSTGAVTVEEVPSGGTEGQVLTQTNNGPAWQNPTGGSEIVYATQAEYTALLPGALTDNKHYFIYSTSGGGGGWQPGANTLAYWKFDGNLNSAFTGGATLSGTPYGYSTGIDGQALDNTNNVQLNSSLTQGDIYSGAFAIAFCVNMQNNTTIQRIFAYGGSPSGSVDIQYEFYNNFSGFQVYTNGLSQRIAFPLINPGIGVWKNIVVTGDGINQIECYIDGVKTNAYSDYNTTFTYPSQNTTFSIRGGDGANNLLDGVIIENKYWTQTDVDTYISAYPVS